MPAIYIRSLICFLFFPAVSTFASKNTFYLPLVRFPINFPESWVFHACSEEKDRDVFLFRLTTAPADGVGVSFDECVFLFARDQREVYECIPEVLDHDQVGCYSVIPGSTHGFVRVDAERMKGVNNHTYFFAKLDDTLCVITLSSLDKHFDYWLTEIDRLLAQIEKKQREANKLPEPTPGSVTVPADAGTAPPPVAAHR